MKKIIIIITVVILGIVSIFCIKNFEEKKDFNDNVENSRENKEFNDKLEKFIAFKAFILPEYENNTETIAKKIRNIKGIKSVEFISREEAFNIMQEELGEEVMEGLDSEIFSHSFEIHCEINNLESIYFEKIEKKIEGIEGIEKVTSNYRTAIFIYNEKGEEVLQKFIDDPENWLEYID